jgi:hypothetical protein
MTTPALKEWHVAVSALAQGETILLLRKGGIREVGKKFAVDCDRVLLYPTYEHQKPDLLKPEYASQVQPVASGWHPETIEIAAWAHITDILQTTDPAIVAALSPFHIWNEAFVRDRLRWKPTQPLYLLLLRVYHLPHPQSIPFSPAYGGCTSWIELEQAIDLNPSNPALTDTAYTTTVSRITTFDKLHSRIPSEGRRLSHPI